MTRDTLPEGERVGGEFRELLRYQRGDETRIYGLRVVPEGAELWRISQRAGEEPRSVKECPLHDPDEAFEFLEEVRRALIVGGWQEVS